MMKEFKEFAVKGNVIDMAVGIIIGAAFSTLVKSLVDDIIMPPLGIMTSEFNFADKFLLIKEGAKAGPYATLAEARTDGASVIAWGTFLNNVVSFIVVATVLFFVVRWINRLRRPDTPAAPNTKACPFCKSSIDISATKCPHCTSALNG